MKHFLVLIFALFVCSCTNTNNVYKLSTACKTPAEQLFNELILIGTENNLNVKTYDLSKGVLILESDVKTIIVGLGVTTFSKQWHIIYNNDTLRAFATRKRPITSETGVIISTIDTYYNDDEAGTDWTWYWDIRNRIEKVCGSKIIFTTTKAN